MIPESSRVNICRIPRQSVEHSWLLANLFCCDYLTRRYILPPRSSQPMSVRNEDTGTRLHQQLCISRRNTVLNCHWYMRALLLNRPLLACHEVQLTRSKSRVNLQHWYSYLHVNLFKSGENNVHQTWTHKAQNSQRRKTEKLAATLRGSRPGVQSASLIMTSLMTS